MIDLEGLKTLAGVIEQHVFGLLRAKIEAERCPVCGNQMMLVYLEAVDSFTYRLVKHINWDRGIAYLKSVKSCEDCINGAPAL